MNLRPEWIEAVKANLPDTHICYVALKGSRLFGIDEPGADVDLRVVFKAPTERMLQLDKPRHTIEAMHLWPCGHCEGFGHKILGDSCVVCFGQGDTEIDFVAYEVERFMHHLRKHNGNFIEALLVPEGYYWADSHGDTLRRLAPKLLTQELCAFYRGFAHGQYKRIRGARNEQSAKNITYCFRELWCGILLLRTGRIEFDFPTLKAWATAEFGESPTLRSLGDRALTRLQLTDEQLRGLEREWVMLNAELDRALQESVLPKTYDATEKLNNHLLRWRSQGWR